MSTGALSIGSPEDAIVSLINGQLTKFYNIPCRISGTLSDSKACDAQAGFESAITGLMAQLAGGNFILHAIGIIEAYNCTSFEKMIVDNELLGYFKHIGRGVEVNDDTWLTTSSKKLVLRANSFPIPILSCISAMNSIVPPLPTDSTMTNGMPMAVSPLIKEPMPNGNKCWKTM